MIVDTISESVDFYCPAKVDKSEWNVSGLLAKYSWLINESDIKGIKSGTKFWENNDIMNAKNASDEPMIERRQGLLERSKTIWALVNPNDYELVLQ
jgi:hypothetical protein